MDARSLSGARPTEFPTPPERAESGLTLVVDLLHGFWLGELNERPWIVHPDGSRSSVELGPPPVDAWVQLVDRWHRQWPDRGCPGVPRPHKALVWAAQFAVGSWTCSTMRDVWMEHSCGHGDWYVETENTKPRLDAYRRHEYGDCSHPHDSFWDD